MLMSGASVTYGIMAPWLSPEEPAPPPAAAVPGGAMTGQRISARVAAVSPSATLAVDAKAKALRAQGESVIGFGAGEPDFATPDHIVAAAETACRDPRSHKYTPTAGLPELREAVAAKTKRRLRARGERVAGPRDQRGQAGGGQLPLPPSATPETRSSYWRRTGPPIPKRSPWRAACPWSSPPTHQPGSGPRSNNWRRPEPPGPRSSCSSRPPTPRAPSTPATEIEAIGRWAVERGLWVLTDEIYEHLVYGDAEHHSMPVLVPELMNQCIVVNGVAKTYAMTGWRVGWMIGPADVVIAATNLQSHETSNVANVSQRAALAAVSGDLEAVADMRRAFDRRRLTVHRMLNEIDGIECNLPEGAFYAFPSVAGLFGREIRGRRPTSSAGSPSWPSRRHRSPWCPVRPSVPPATSGCRMR